jgi:hypothetical protein
MIKLCIRTVYCIPFHFPIHIHICSLFSLEAFEWLYYASINAYRVSTCYHKCHHCLKQPFFKMYLFQCKGALAERMKMMCMEEHGQSGMSSGSSGVCDKKVICFTLILCC